MSQNQPTPGGNTLAPTGLTSNFEIQLVAEDLYKVGLFSDIDTSSAAGKLYVYNFALSVSSDLSLFKKMQFIAASYLNLY
jgi:hypothetical protein